MPASRIIAWATCLVAVLMLVPGGCTITLDPNDPNTGGGGGEGEGGGGETPTTITVRVINNTGNTLDPQIYVAGEPVDVEHLFTASRKYTNFGVGRLGLIAGNDNDSFTIECANARVVGTKGGSFGGGDDGNDLNNPAGSGLQRVLTQELVFFCGDRITFTYSTSGDGFTTTFDIDP